MDWTELETTRHQEHVIKHVLGASVLGWFVAGEAAHLLLDIGFLWTIYLDGEMNLVPQGVAIAELKADEASSAGKAELAFDADMLLSEGRHASGLKRFTTPTVECLINSVDVLAAESLRRVAINRDPGQINIDTSLEAGEVTVSVHRQ